LRFILIGFGKFGRLSFDRLRTTFRSAEFVIVDPELQPGPVISDKIRLIRAGGAEFLSYDDQLTDTDLIVPVAPFNIAAAYIKDSCKQTESVSFPEDLAEYFENCSFVDQFTLCVSNANFICPDDCPEGDTCTVTGQRRIPMYERIERINAYGFKILVVRSFQLAPGVGGYTYGNLKSLREVIRSTQNYIIATSCKCHAILSSIKVNRGDALL